MMSSMASSDRPIVRRIVRSNENFSAAICEIQSGNKFLMLQAITAKPLQIDRHGKSELSVHPISRRAYPYHAKMVNARARAKQRGARKEQSNYFFGPTFASRAQLDSRPLPQFTKRWAVACKDRCHAWV